MATTKRSTPAPVKVIDINPADPNEFFLMDVYVGEDEPLRFKMLDPVAARELVDEVTKKGTFTRTIDGGMQSYPVKSVKLTGPYIANEEVSNSKQQDGLDY
jgi:hypothetical protein